MNTSYLDPTIEFSMLKMLFRNGCAIGKEVILNKVTH